jgi:hypothetical protein
VPPLLSRVALAAALAAPEAEGEGDTVASQAVGVAPRVAGAVPEGGVGEGVSAAGVALASPVLALGLALALPVTLALALPAGEALTECEAAGV